MDGCKVIIAGAYAYDLIGHLDSVAIFGIHTGNKGISIACLHHHHAEIVALVHFINGLLERVTTPLHFFASMRA